MLWCLNNRFRYLNTITKWDLNFVPLMCYTSLLCKDTHKKKLKLKLNLQNSKKS